MLMGTKNISRSYIRGISKGVIMDRKAEYQCAKDIDENKQIMIKELFGTTIYFRTFFKTF